MLNYKRLKINDMLPNLGQDRRHNRTNIVTRIPEIYNLQIIRLENHLKIAS